MDFKKIVLARAADWKAGIGAYGGALLVAYCGATGGHMTDLDTLASIALLTLLGTLQKSPAPVPAPAPAPAQK